MYPHVTFAQQLRVKWLVEAYVICEQSPKPTYTSVDSLVFLEHFYKTLLGIMTAILCQALGDDEHGISVGLYSQSLFTSYFVLVLLQSLTKQC